MSSLSAETRPIAEAAPRVLVVGEALIDIVRRPGVPPVEYVGGSPANVALGLGRLGVPVRLRTALGADARGELIAAHLLESGVAIDPASWSLARTSTAVAHIGTGGAATYEFDLDWNVPEPLRLSGERVVHVGSAGAFLEPGASVLEAFLTSIGDRAMVTFDPNIRPALTGDHATALQRVERLAMLANVVKLSDEDAAWLYPERSVDRVLDLLLDHGVSLVVITLGGNGAIIASRTGRVQVRAPRVTVVDTVGAGDTFMAALIDRVFDVSLGVELGDRLSAIGSFAAEAAAVTVQRAGADLPYAHELRASSR